MPAEPAPRPRVGADVRRADLGALVVRARASEQTVLQARNGPVPVGWVQSALKVLDDAPNQRDGAPQAWIRFYGKVAQAAQDPRPGDEILVLTWLHLSPRYELSTHPQDDLSQPLTGVFSTCSPNRPNPIGLHGARIVARGPATDRVSAPALARAGARKSGSGRAAAHKFRHAP